MTVHDLNSRLRVGDVGERIVLRLLRKRGNRVRRATFDEQRHGIDLMLTRNDQRSIAVEVKWDERAADTGHVFIEIVCSDGRPGWLRTSMSQWLLYGIPGRRVVVVYQFDELRQRVERWSRCCQTTVARNVGYNTEGLLVPVDDFIEHALAVWFY